MSKRGRRQSSSPDPATSSAKARQDVQGHQRAGRRPGPTTTRTDILDAARAEFGEKGFDRATLRSIARIASVDVALIAHYFSTKQELFIAAMFPLHEGPTLLGDVLATAPKKAVGEVLATKFLDMLAIESARTTLLGLLRASATDEHAAELMRNSVNRVLVAPLTTYLDGPRASVRAAMIGAAILGFVNTRYILQLPALRDTDTNELVVELGRSIQRLIDSA